VGSANGLTSSAGGHGIILPKPEATTVDEYLAALPADRRGPMADLRKTIRAAAPDATEVITYKMPGFKLNGRFLVSYDAFKHHYSLFPSSVPIVDQLGDRVRPFLAGKGTLRFPADQPLPLDLIADIVRIRVEENVAEERSRGVTGPS
jgi:uncharacterized protein YdhG (YjbR/CyaY superfamily)